MKPNGFHLKNIPGFPDIEWYIDESMHKNEIIAWDQSKLTRVINKDTGEEMLVYGEISDLSG